MLKNFKAKNPVKNNGKLKTSVNVDKNNVIGVSLNVDPEIFYVLFKELFCDAMITADIKDSHPALRLTKFNASLNAYETIWIMFHTEPEISHDDHA
jgi:hypothetical protein